MKGTAWLCLPLILFAACATADRPTAASTSNARLVSSLYEAFGRGDVPAVLGAFDQNVIWEEAEGSNYADKSPYRGPQAVAEGLFQRLGTEWNGFRVNPQQIIDGGETVVVLGRYAGTYKRTGKPLDSQFAHVWTVRNGRVVKFQQYTDTAQYARVTGL